MVEEACSRKSTFRPDSGFVFLSGLRLASSNFGNFVRISDLAYFLYQVNQVFNGMAVISLFYNRLSSLSPSNLNVIMITPADIYIISVCVEGFLFGNISFYVLQIVPLLLVAKEIPSRCLFRNIQLISAMPIGQVLGSFSKRRLLYPLYSLRSQCC